MVRHALYRFRDANGALLWVGVSHQLARRLLRHQYHSPWFGEVASVAVEWFPDRASAEAAETQAIRTERPAHNVLASRNDPRGHYQKHHEPPTAFGHWIKANGLTNTAMAERLGVTQSHVSYIARGATKPSAKLRAAIERETGGAVPASSWAMPEAIAAE